MNEARLSETSKTDRSAENWPAIIHQTTEPKAIATQKGVCDQLFLRESEAIPVSTSTKVGSERIVHRDYCELGVCASDFRIVR